MSQITGLYKEELSRNGLLLKECEKDSFEQNLTTEYESMLKDLSKQVTEKDLKIRIYWIENDSVNATVVKIQDTYCIGLFSGITTSLIDHINHYYRDGINEFDGLELPTISAFYNVTESSTNEGKLGNYIFTMSFLYLVMHEFGHIICGHCEKENDIAVLFEEMRNEGGNYFKQAKECVADFYGVINSYDYFLPSCLGHLGDIGLITTLYITSVHTIFWIFAFNKDSIHDTNHSKLTHPHPVIRMTYFFILIENELRNMLEIFERQKKIYLLVDNPAEKIVDAAIEDFFNILSRTDVDFNADDTLSELCDKELKRIDKSVEEVKEFYKEASYVRYV
ncbi:MAG: hypothetical protein E7248_08365 [Paenibacillaceae bacterium]|nr:hypothetical protein [Paenibacillaceae bacterium]